MKKFAKSILLTSFALSSISLFAGVPETLFNGKLNTSDVESLLNDQIASDVSLEITDYRSPKFSAISNLGLMAERKKATVANIEIAITSGRVKQPIDDCQLVFSPNGLNVHDEPIGNVVFLQCPDDVKTFTSFFDPGREVSLKKMNYLTIDVNDVMQETEKEVAAE